MHRVASLQITLRTMCCRRCWTAFLASGNEGGSVLGPEPELDSVGVRVVVEYVWTHRVVKVEEREWRAIYTPMIRSSPLMKSSVETIGGVPRTVYHMPLDASFDLAVEDLDFAKILDRVIIGPTPYPLAMQRAFQTKLGEARSLAAVVMSKIPLRTQV
jgi:hypothetical protein